MAALSSWPAERPSRFLPCAGKGDALGAEGDYLKVSTFVGCGSLATGVRVFAAVDLLSGLAEVVLSCVILGLLVGGGGGDGNGTLQRAVNDLQVYGENFDSGAVAFWADLLLSDAAGAGVGLGLNFVVGLVTAAAGVVGFSAATAHPAARVYCRWRGLHLGLATVGLATVAVMVTVVPLFCFIVVLALWLLSLYAFAVARSHYDALLEKHAEEDLRRGGYYFQMVAGGPGDESRCPADDAARTRHDTHSNNPLLAVVQ